MHRFSPFFVLFSRFTRFGRIYIKRTRRWIGFPRNGTLKIRTRRGWKVVRYSARKRSLVIKLGRRPVKIYIGRKEVRYSRGKQWKRLLLFRRGFRWRISRGVKRRGKFYKRLRRRFRHVRRVKRRRRRARRRRRNRRAKRRRRRARRRRRVRRRIRRRRRRSRRRRRRRIRRQTRRSRRSVVQILINRRYVGVIPKYRRLYVMWNKRLTAIRYGKWFYFLVLKIYAEWI